MKTHSKPFSPGESSLAARARNRRHVGGQVFFLITVSMVFMLGFMALAIDFSMAVLRAHELQRACDAAALAAGVNMRGGSSTGTATTEAQLVGSMNKATITNVSFNAATSTTAATITVTGTATQAFYFAPILGFKSTLLTRYAKTTYGTITGVNGGIPVGITPDDYNNHLGGGQFTLSLIRNQDTAFADGNAIALSVSGNDGKSPSHWQDALQSGDPLVYMGVGADPVSLNSALGEEQTRLYNGLSGRIGQTLALFITEPIPQVNGNSPHDILGIAIVKLINVDQNGNLTLQISQEALSPSGGVYNPPPVGSGTGTGITNGMQQVSLVP